VVALATTAASLVLWLEDHVFDITTWLAVALGLLLLLTIVVEIRLGYGRRAADWVLPWVMMLLWPLEMVVAAAGVRHPWLHPAVQIAKGDRPARDRDGGSS